MDDESETPRLRSESLLSAARAARLAGRPQDAASLCEEAVKADPENAAAHAELGLQHLMAGRLPESVTPLRQSLALQPASWLANGWLATALRHIDPIESLAAYDRALGLKPHEPGLQSNRGNVLLDLGRCDEAAAAFEAATRSAPDMALAWMNLGHARFQLGMRLEAVAAFDRALSINPDLANAYSGRAGAYMALERWSEALADYDRALHLNAEDARSHLGRARALVELDFLSPVSPETNIAALASFDRAVVLEPNLAEARWSRALTRLRLGRFADGWDDYEHRWDAPSFVSRSSGQVSAELRQRLVRDIDAEALQGRVITIVAEQGIGDVLLFASILPDILARADRVSLVCETRLHRLFAASFPTLRLLPPGGDVDAGDLVLAIGSLGKLFRPTADHMPGRPYLRASETVFAEWGRRLGPANGRVRVGVSWRGGRQHTGAAARSVSLEQLSSLLGTSGCEFISLQYGDVAAELADWNAGRRVQIHSPPGDVEDFEDLAGLVQNLDVVISVQTAVVHLSGAVGTPCLTLVPRKPEWRYGVYGDRLPWYGSVRLFRQGPAGDWAPVVARITEELARLS